MLLSLQSKLTGMKCNFTFERSPVGSANHAPVTCTFCCRDSGDESGTATGQSPRLGPGDGECRLAGAGFTGRGGLQRSPVDLRWLVRLIQSGAARCVELRRRQDVEA